jgi:hypothetical protein
MEFLRYVLIAGTIFIFIGGGLAAFFTLMILAGPPDAYDVDITDQPNKKEPR